MNQPTRSHLAAFAAVVFAALALPALGCSGGDQPAPTKPTAEAPAAGCKTDMDCKGNRVCVQSQCVDPAPGTKTSPRPRPAGQPPAPPPPPAPRPAAHLAPPGGFTAIPTERDYRAVREITVTGSSRMNCETKRIREWVRIRCHGKNESGSSPRAMTVIRSNAPDHTFTQQSGDQVELLYPFFEGVHLEAVFRWTGGERHHFVSRWSAGSAEPAAKGEFLGVAPPTDPNRRWPCQSDADCNSPYQCGHQGNCQDFGQGTRPNKRFPCQSDADCNAPYTCGYQGNCMR